MIILLTPAKRRLLATAFACIMLSPSGLYAAEEPPKLKEIVEKSDVEKAAESVETTPVKGPPDEFGRTTPRSSTLGLARALEEMDFETAVEYMDLRNLPFTIDEADGPELARKLLIVADRSMIVDYEAISDDPDGHADDGLPHYRDRITTVKTSEGLVDILMQKVPRSDGIFIWKLSNATVAKIPELIEEFGYGPIGDKLTLIFPHYYVFGLELWQWAMVVVLLVAGYVCAYVITCLLFKLISSYRKDHLIRTEKFVNGPHFNPLTFLQFYSASKDIILEKLSGGISYTNDINIIDGSVIPERRRKRVHTVFPEDVFEMV